MSVDTSAPLLAPPTASMLGREDFLCHRRIAEGFADASKLAPVFMSVQAPDHFPRKR